MTGSYGPEGPSSALIHRATFDPQIRSEDFIPGGAAVAKLDHLALTVEDLVATRDWYASVVGLDVEFDTGNVTGLKDEGDFTLILSQDGSPPSKCALYLQVEDVHTAYAEMSARDVTFL
jgi:hypothetical protein